MGTMNFAVAAALFEGALAVLAVSMGWVLGRPPMTSFKPNVVDLGWGIIAALPLLAGFWGLSKSRWRPFARIMQVLDEMFVPLFRQCGMLEMAVIALLAGLGEEMLFRGIVQSWVADKVGGDYGRGIGLVAAAAIFGLLHGVTPAYAMLAGGVGLYLGAIWLATGNLLTPIAGHALYDFLAFVYLVYGRKPKAASQGGEGRDENLPE
jgi:membrane protease YdiL (CAAX protease family)